MPFEFINGSYYWVQTANKGPWKVAIYNDGKFSVMAESEGKMIVKQYTKHTLWKVEHYQLVRYEQTGRKSQVVRDLVGKLKVGQFLIRDVVLNQYWGHADEFNRRSFDVLFSKVKKENPEKEFKTIRGSITRIS